VSADTAALAGRRVVITGGAGFIGSAIARQLAGVAASVVVVDAFVPEHGGSRRNLAGLDSVRLVERDIADAAAALADADVVFNLAGQRSHTDSMRDPATDLHHNVEAQLALLESCRTAAPDATVVFASTRQVYGRVRRLPADESEHVAPRDVNGIHKAAAESYHRLYYDVHGLRTVVLRLTNSYGPGMRIRDARQGFLGAWIRALVLGEEFEVWGGAQRRDFNYLDDVVDAFLLAATTPALVGGTFNLGGDAATLREAADLLVELSGGSYRILPLPDEAAAIDIGDYVGDYSRFHAETGWEPRVSLAEGLRRTVDHYRAHGEDYL
jgi:UDP-glucose 4-epimerase